MRKCNETAYNQAFQHCDSAFMKVMGFRVLGLEKSLKTVWLFLVFLNPKPHNLDPSLRVAYKREKRRRLTSCNNDAQFE